MAWSSLSAFGNSPFVRLVAAAPLVATFVKFDAKWEWLAPYISEATWLYWSLMLIAAGQILYWLFCPRIIKKYGRDEERYTIDSLTSFPIRRLRLMRTELLRHLYDSKQLTMPITLDGRETPEPDFRKLVVGMRGPGTANLAHYFVVYSAYQACLAGDDAEGQSVDWSGLRDMTRTHPELLIGFENRNDDAQLLMFNVIVGSIPNDSDWKVLTLNWKYQHENQRLRLVVLLIGALYAAGSIYFGWRTLTTLFFMAGVKLG